MVKEDTVFDTERNGKPFASVVKALLALSLLAIVFASPASAEPITYVCTGNAFNSFHGSFACPPERKITCSFTHSQVLGESSAVPKLAGNGV